MENGILPLGTVVTLTDGDGTELMIIGRGMVIQVGKWIKKDIYYDYGAVCIPKGLDAPENVCFFNKEQVFEVLHRGFVNDDELVYQENYDTWILNLNLEKGDVD